MSSLQITECVCYFEVC